jgi:hypothetical protein
MERPRGRSTPKGVYGQQELAWSKGKRQTGSATALLSRSRRCTVTERDQKGRSWKGVRLCMDVCRGGIIDSPPPLLKTALSPFISILFLFLFACLHFHLLDNFSHTLFLPSAAVSRSRRVHPRAAFTPTSNWIRTPDLSRPASYYTNVLLLQQAYSLSFTNRYTFSVALSFHTSPVGYLTEKRRQRRQRRQRRDPSTLTSLPLGRRWKTPLLQTRLS